MSSIYKTLYQAHKPWQQPSFGPGLQFVNFEARWISGTSRKQIFGGIPGHSVWNSMNFSIHYNPPMTSQELLCLLDTAQNLICKIYVQWASCKAIWFGICLLQNLKLCFQPDNVIIMPKMSLNAAKNCRDPLRVE